MLFGFCKNRHTHHITHMDDSQAHAHTHPHQNYGLRNDIDEDTMRNFDEKNENDDGWGRKTKSEEKKKNAKYIHTYTYTTNEELFVVIVVLRWWCGIKVDGFHIPNGAGADAVVLYLPNFYNEIMFRFSHWASTQITHTPTQLKIHFTCIKYVQQQQCVCVWAHVVRWCKASNQNNGQNFRVFACVQHEAVLSSVCIWLKYYKLKSLRAFFFHSLSLHSFTLLKVFVYRFIYYYTIFNMRPRAPHALILRKKT